MKNKKIKLWTGIVTVAISFGLVGSAHAELTPIQVKSSSSYKNFKTILVESTKLGDVDTSELSDIKCKQNQVQPIAELVAKIAAQYGVPADQIIKNISINTRNWNTYNVGYVTHMSHVGSHYDYSCATDLKSSSDKITFVEKSYEVSMPSKKDTEVCANAVEELAAQNGFINATYEVTKVAHKTWICALTTMSLELK